MIGWIFVSVCAQWSIQSRLTMISHSLSLMDDVEWVKQNICQFLMYCNSWLEAEKMALFLRSWLPVHAHDRIVWYHSSMSEEFKKETIITYGAGEILGLCCTDACGMVSDWISQGEYQLTNLYKGPWSMMCTDCSTISNPKKAWCIGTAIWPCRKRFINSSYSNSPSVSGIQVSSVSRATPKILDMYV